MINPMNFINNMNYLDKTHFINNYFIHYYHIIVLIFNSMVENSLQTYFNKLMDFFTSVTLINSLILKSLTILINPVESSSTII